MKLFYFLILGMICFTSCQTMVKDEPEIEKVLEDGTKELIEDLEHVS